MEWFVKSVASVRFWRKALVGAAAASVPLFLLKTYVPPVIGNVTVLSYYSIAVPMLYNFAFMVLLVSVFVLAWFHHGDKGYAFQRMPVACGRMSLTNYIGQSVIGVAIYYHWGFGLYNSVGAAGSALIGLGIFFVQLSFSRYWLSRHAQGPLEYLWKRGTWL